MEKYIKDPLAGTGFFFMGKKDGTLRPYIHYRRLNDITVKKKQYPFPLISSAFRLLQGAMVFTKLHNLHNAYHLVHIQEGDEWKTAFNTPTGHSLTSLTIQFQWTPTAERAFETFKTRVTSAPILQIPDLDRQLIMEVDILDIGIDLLPEAPPLCFFLERNYDILNQKLLAVKMALEEWRHWLEGTKKPFHIWMDHKNLEYI